MNDTMNVKLHFIINYYCERTLKYLGMISIGEFPNKRDTNRLIAR